MVPPRLPSCPLSGHRDFAVRPLTQVPDTVENLILDLLEWLARKDYTYEETFAAWRTSCPRLTVWEDANDRGLLICEATRGRTLVRPTLAGLALLQKHRPEIYSGLQDEGADSPVTAVANSRGTDP